MFGKTEQLVLVLVIILVLFGARKLPELAKGIGSAVRELRRGFSGDLKEDADESKTARKK